MTKWTKREEELFEKAWKSDAYDEDALTTIFGRTLEALKKKAKSLGLPPRWYVDEQARIQSIEEALKEAHLI